MVRENPRKNPKLLALFQCIWCLTGRNFKFFKTGDLQTQGWIQSEDYALDRLHHILRQLRPSNGAVAFGLRPQGTFEDSQAGNSLWAIANPSSRYGCGGGGVGVLVIEVWRFLFHKAYCLSPK